MEIITGKFTKAVIHADSNNFVEDYARSQITQICNQRAVADSSIHIMPDVHPGAVCPIGFTMTIKDAIIPNLVGVDIGCGVTVAKIKNKKHLEYKQLDAIIREKVPSGFNIKTSPHRYALYFDFDELMCLKHIDIEKAKLSIGSLGSGNHFIEFDKDDDGNLYLIVHSGSRHLGQEVSSYYTAKGHKLLLEKKDDTPYELTYIDGELKDAYIHDLLITQKFADINRRAIIDTILKGIKAKAAYDIFSCYHNYVSNENGITILRKGAIAANKDERVVIPINMKDGVIIGSGKGNPDWNYSAPHGSGRIMNRT